MRPFLFMLMFVFMVISALFATAFAHEDGRMKYDPECCHDMDCAPVDKVEMVPAAKYAGLGFTSKLPSIMLVTTKHGTVRVPYDDPTFKPRKSTDGRSHACIRPAVGMTPARLICFYEAPGN